ncbi:MAG: ribbon-helix-helix domain-containing protein [Alphaproteobacteria bacterium]
MNRKSSLVSRNVTINGRRTSLRMEKSIWDALGEICQREAVGIHDLCTLIDNHRHITNRTSAIRAFIVAYYRAAATEDGHRRAGHGIGAEKNLLGVVQSL